MAEIKIGTLSNPLIFTGVIAGQEYIYPNNPVFLWNDKGGIHNSFDANEITIEVLSMNIVDELVGYSNGNPNQTFIVGYPPVIAGDAQGPLVVKVNGVVWTYTLNIGGASGSDQVFAFDYTTGTVTFGDGVHGQIPNVGATIEISYSPDTLQYGTEIAEFNWLGVQSVGVQSNPVTMQLERQISADTTHVIVGHVPIVVVTGVWLNSDPKRLGTNYYTGGSFDALLGILTLGTALPSANTTVLIDYQYTIKDDLESTYTQIGQGTKHTFTNPIPSNNAKRLNFRILAPATTSPSGMLNLQFRIAITYQA
jgi:hypothetical protein